MVHVYLINVKKFCDEAIIRSELEKLPKNARETISKYKILEDKALHLGGWKIFMAGLKRYHLNEKNLDIKYNKYGKPYISNYPHLYYNISHSGEYAVCAFSSKELGIDIQKIGHYHVNLMNKYFSLEEKEYILDSKNSEVSKERFCLVWSLKESYIKAQGLSCLQMKPSMITINNKKIVNIEGYNFYEYQALVDYKIIVCAKESQFCKKLHIITD